MKNIAVVLSAGFSKRMGEFKPLLKTNGKTIIEEVICSISKIEGIDETVIISGFNNRDLSLAIKDSTKIIFNENYESGMFSSIKVGLKYALGKKANVLLFTVDSPLINDVQISQMLEKAENDGSFYRPSFLNKNGHPLFIPFNEVENILNYKGKFGIKGYLYKKEIKTFEFTDESPIFDIDYQEDYLEFINLELIDESFKLPHLSNRIVLFRHGLQEQMEEKIFLGQTDIPLSKQGMEQVTKKVETLLEEIGSTNIKIFSSPLLRAKESAEIIAEIFTNCNYNVETKILHDLTEISLGEWDGKSIREIQEKHPCDYQRRGLDILKFKPLCGENFYDVRYRAIRALRKIRLETEEEDTVIIVSHKGMLKCIKSILDRNLDLRSYLDFNIGHGDYFILRNSSGKV